jgi:hypothetical protein
MDSSLNRGRSGHPCPFGFVDGFSGRKKDCFFAGLKKVFKAPAQKTKTDKQLQGRAPCAANRLRKTRA